MGAIYVSLTVFALGLLLLFVRNVQLKKDLGILRREEERQWARGEFYLASKKCLELWIRKKNEGKEVVSFFQNRGIKRVAIYGLSQTGRLLYEELRKTEVAVVCGIDRSKNYSVNRLPTIRLDAVTPEGLLKDVELVVVIPIYDFPSIYDTLNEKLHGRIPIVGLDEILCEL